MNKKVLFVASITGHIKSFHIPYLEWFKKQGYEVHVACRGNEKIEFCDKQYNLPFERFPLKLNNIKTYRELKKIIIENNYDIIHCHTPTAGVLTRLAAKNARKHGTKVFYTAHGFHFYKGAPILNWIIYYPIEWFLAKLTDTLITINSEDYKLANKKFSKRCYDIQYVPGVGIDVKKFDIKMNEKQKEKYKESLGLKKDDFILTCIARLDTNKNQGFLIKVVEELIKEYKNIHLLLVGRDELNGYYQNIVKKKKMDKYVHFLGNRDDVPELLAITDVVLCASKREGLPVNVMEAFAAKKPVVALECRGMKDLIENEINGYIVTNIESYIKCINIIYNDKTSSYEYINILDKLQIESVVNKYKDIYLINKKEKGYERKISICSNSNL